MTPLTISIGAFVIALTLGAAVVWGTPVFGLPIIAFVLLLFGAIEFRRRMVRSRSIDRHRTRDEKVQFTERDKETLT